MPKRRVRFDEESNVSVKVQRTNDQTALPEEDQEDVPVSGSRLSLNNDHTIDSDEEEETKRKSEDFEKLNEDDIEGAEDGDVGDELHNEPDAKITPFNLKEEMEEGDFDVDGHYHFKKDQEIRDNWLDNIDWVKVTKPLNSQDGEWDDDDSDDDVATASSNFDEIKVIENIVKLLKKGETVGAAIRRLGSTEKKSKKKNWKRSKVYDLEADEDENEEEGEETNDDERKASFTELTELADQMASAGHYDVYTDTYEKLQYKLNSLKISKQAASIFPDDDVSDDDALDMFGDDIDSKQTKESSKKDDAGKSESTSDDQDDDSDVRWEYKWNEKDPTVYGPFTSDQMAEWKGKGFFQDTLVVRKVDKSVKDAVFYSARRIDFDLYT